MQTQTNAQVITVTMQNYQDILPAAKHALYLKYAQLGFGTGIYKAMQYNVKTGVIHALNK